MKTTAILVDGGFFVRRFGTVYPGIDRHDPSAVAETMNRMCLAHLYTRGGKGQGSNKVADLYRIYFYDCPPLEKRLHTPLSKKAFNLATQPEALFRKALHAELRQNRKTAAQIGSAG